MSKAATLPAIAVQALLKSYYLKWAEFVIEFEFVVCCSLSLD